VNKRDLGNRMASDNRGEQQERDQENRGHVSRFRNAVTLAATW
jgi:hypothetical protein